MDVRQGRASTLVAVRLALRPIYIPDEDFEADFAALRLRNRSTSGKRLRYILAKLEKQLSGADITDEGMTATVEHILPENPGEAGWEHFTADAHERSYERVGNFETWHGKRWCAACSGRSPSWGLAFPGAKAAQPAPGYFSFMSTMPSRMESSLRSRSMKNLEGPSPWVRLALTAVNRAMASGMSLASSAASAW